MSVCYTDKYIHVANWFFRITLCYLVLFTFITVSARSVLSKVHHFAPGSITLKIFYTNMRHITHSTNICSNAVPVKSPTQPCEQVASSVLAGGTCLVKTVAETF